MNEEEDRRRLKEKLKEALESARRNMELHEESEGEVQPEILTHLIPDCTKRHYVCSEVECYCGWVSDRGD